LDEDSARELPLRKLLERKELERRVGVSLSCDAATALLSRDESTTPEYCTATSALDAVGVNDGVTDLFDVEVTDGLSWRGGRDGTA
jgi:hypothetical protein